MPITQAETIMIRDLCDIAQDPSHSPGDRRAALVQAAAIQNDQSGGADRVPDDHIAQVARLIRPSIPPEPWKKRMTIGEARWFITQYERDAVTAIRTAEQMRVDSVKAWGQHFRNGGTLPG